MNCSHCGTYISSGAYCPNCGTPITSNFSNTHENNHYQSNNSNSVNYQYLNQQHTKTKRSSALGIISFILTVLVVITSIGLENGTVFIFISSSYSWIFFIICFVLALLTSFILALVAVFSKKSSIIGRGFAIASIIILIINLMLFFLPIMFIIFHFIEFIN